MPCMMFLQLVRMTDDFFRIGRRLCADPIHLSLDARRDEMATSEQPFLPSDCSAVVGRLAVIYRIVHQNRKESLGTLFVLFVEISLSLIHPFATRVSRHLQNVAPNGSLWRLSPCPCPATHEYESYIKNWSIQHRFGARNG